jgi:aquaporin Z
LVHSARHFFISFILDRPMPSRQLLAEAFGTFCLVFAGTGAAVVNEVTRGGVTHVGVALTFGLVVMTMVYALGRCERARVLPYIASQCAGALLASGTLRLLFPESNTLGATLPAGSDLQSLGLEFVLTLILMFTVLAVSAPGAAGTIPAGIVVGGVIGFEALFAGPISGASMNPARSLAPAVVSQQLGALWIYVIAPIAGALASVPLYHWIHGPAEDRSDGGRENGGTRA